MFFAREEIMWYQRLIQLDLQHRSDDADENAMLSRAYVPMLGKVLQKGELVWDKDVFGSRKNRAESLKTVKFRSRFHTMLSGIYRKWLDFMWDWKWTSNELWGMNMCEYVRWYGFARLECGYSIDYEYGNKIRWVAMFIDYRDGVSPKVRFVKRSRAGVQSIECVKGNDSSCLDVMKVYRWEEMFYVFPRWIPNALLVCIAVTWFLEGLISGFFVMASILSVLYPVVHDARYNRYWIAIVTDTEKALIRVRFRYNWERILGHFGRDITSAWHAWSEKHQQEDTYAET